MIKPAKLHLGCFKKKIHGFINVDIREDVEPDVVDDILTLTKFGSDSADLIYACHVLEHTSREGSMKALARWFEVLKVGGTLRISVPDIKASCEYYLENGDLRVLQAMFYGSQKHPYDFHYNGWDQKTLTEDLEKIGFKNVRLYDWRNTEHFFVDDYSQCYLPKMSYSTRRPDGVIDGKLVSLNVEADK